MCYKSLLFFFLFSEYNTIQQISNPDKYISCKVFEEHPGLDPGNEKVCMQTIAEFGPKCQNEHLYGLPTMPCILLVLKLVRSYIIFWFRILFVQRT